MLELVPVLLLATFLGGLVQGISGFAFGIVFIAIMQNFMPYTELLALSALLCIVMLAVNAFLYRKHIVWRWLPLPLAINFVFVMGALRFLKYTASFPYWHKLLGVVFILLSLYLYFWQQKLQIRPTLRNALLFCGTGGIMTGLFGMGGPPMVLYFLAIANDKEQYLSTSQMFFFFTVLYEFAGRWLNDMVHTSTLQYAAIGVGAVLLGLWIGNRIFRYIDVKLLKSIIYGIMFVNGWYMLLCR